MDNIFFIGEARPQFETWPLFAKIHDYPPASKREWLLFKGGLYSQKYGTAVVCTNIVFVCGHVDLLYHGSWVGHVEKYFVVVATYHISSNRGFLQIEASSI